MPRIFINHKQPRFIFFTNYKVMSSSILGVMSKFFPEAALTSPSGKLFYMEDYSKLAICRDPYSRLFSVYYDKCLIDPKAKQEGRRKMFLQDPQEKILLYYYKIKRIPRKVVIPGEVLTEADPDYKCLNANLSDLARISIHDFILSLKEMFAGKNIDHHFIPQVTFLTEKNQMKMDYIYKMEEIEIHWPEICSILGKEVPLLRNNPTDFSLINRQSGKNDLSVPEQQIVRELYRKDFEIFGYQDF